jgi:hypothetical protein
MFDVTSDNTAYHFHDLLPVMVLGVIGGILGSFYNFLLIKILRVYTLINEYMLLSYLCYNFFYHVKNLCENLISSLLKRNCLFVTKYSASLPRLCPLCFSSPKKEVGVPITVHVCGWCVESMTPHICHMTYLY